MSVTAGSDTPPPTGSTNTSAAAGAAHPTAQIGGSAGEGATPYRWRWLVLFLVLAAEVMDLLDATIVNVAVPVIREDLGGSYSSLQWIAAGYTLAIAVMLITGGRLGDIFGRRRMFLIGLVGFTTSSTLCALAQSPEMLIGSRVLQGALGAIMIPQGLGIIKSVFPPREMAAAFGMFGPVMGLSAVCGPILAGVLVDADLFGTGWRMIFLINVPLGLFALIGSLKFMPEAQAERGGRLDLLGTVLVSAAAFLIVFPLVQGREHDWPAWAFVMMAAALVFFALFGWHQARTRRRGNPPLVEPSLLRNRAFVAGLVVALAFFAAMAGFMLVFGLYAQIGLGYTPLRAGLTMAPWSLGTAIAAGLAGAVLAPRFGRRVLHAGLVVMIIGGIGVYLTVRHYGVDVTAWNFVPATFVSGLGMGLLLAPLFDIVLAGVRDHEVGSASGILTSAQQLGSALGVAVIATVFFGLVGSHATAAADSVTPQLRAELAAAGVPDEAQGPIVAGFRACARDQANAKGDEVPASCRPDPARPADPAVAKALEAAGSKTVKHDFGAAIERTVWPIVGLLAVTGLLAFLLPRRARVKDTPETSGTGSVTDPDGDDTTAGDNAGDGPDGTVAAEPSVALT